MEVSNEFEMESSVKGMDKRCRLAISLVTVETEGTAKKDSAVEIKARDAEFRQYEASVAKGRGKK